MTPNEHSNGGAQSVVPYDPSRNVLDLVNASIKRIDDLNDSRFKRVDDIISQEVKRNDERYATNDRKFEQTIGVLTASITANMSLRAEYTEKVTQQLGLQTSQLFDRIGLLEKMQSENKGRSGVADPQIERLTAVVERLASAQATGTGKSEGISSSWAILIGAVALIGALLGLSGKLNPTQPTVSPLTIAPISAPAPQIMYLPSPVTQLPPTK